jgi:hypothetical protein
MWIYLALGFGVLIAFNILVAAGMTLAARYRESRGELRSAHRAHVITYVR